MPPQPVSRQIVDGLSHAVTVADGHGSADTHAVDLPCAADPYVELIGWRRGSYLSTVTTAAVNQIYREVPSAGFELATYRSGVSS